MKKKKKICLTYRFNPIQPDLCGLGWVELKNPLNPTHAHL